MAVIAPLSVWARTLLQLTPPAVAYWLSHGGTGQFAQVVEPPPPTTICKLTAKFQRTSALALTDDAEQFSLHFINTTDGEVDNSWTQTDIEDVVGYFGNELVNNLLPFLTPKITCESIIVHLFEAGNNPGPMQGEYPHGGPGTASGSALPQQVACSVTLETAHRRHWGRFYLPGITTTALDAYGRYTDTFINSVADVATAFVGGLVGYGFPPVVYSRTAESAMGITGVRVDDVPDVIRRRRAKDTLIRHGWDGTASY